MKNMNQTASTFKRLILLLINKLFDLSIGDIGFYIDVTLKVFLFYFCSFEKDIHMID